MDRKNIITLPNTELRIPSQKVTVVDEEVKKIVQDMKDATLDWEDNREHEVSVGLAGVQVNIHKNIFIVREDYTDKENKNFLTFINPEIIKRSGALKPRREGCISIPDVYGMVPRHETVKIRAQDENGQWFTLKVSGFPAQIMQHELDHTKGKLFVDLIEDEEEAFMELGEDGEMHVMDYSDVKARNILR